MANTNFKIFAESAANLMGDAEYEVDTQRTNGVTPGLAEPELHNKLYKQATMMAAAFAQVLVSRGYNAMDNDYESLVANIKRAFPVSINGKTAGANGDIDYRLLSFSDVYPVGAIYTTLDPTNPHSLFGGTWEQIGAGRCLVGAGSGYNVGTTGGEATHTITVNEMPSHKHTASITTDGNHNHTNSVTSNGDHGHSISMGDAGNHGHENSVNNAGSHSHSISISSVGDHKHNRGTMNITGSFGLATDRALGAFNIISTSYEHLKFGESSAAGVDFDASRSWTGESSAAGSHSHSVSITDAGSHNHTVSITANGTHKHSLSLVNAGSHNHTVTINTAGNHTHTVTLANTGSGAAMNNMQPYLVVYFWKRTA